VLCCFHSLISTIVEVIPKHFGGHWHSDSISGQMCRDKKCPFSGVTNYTRVLLKDIWKWGLECFTRAHTHPPIHTYTKRHVVIWYTQNMCWDGSSFLWHQTCTNQTALWLIFSNVLCKVTDRRHHDIRFRSLQLVMWLCKCVAQWRLLPCRAWNISVFIDVCRLWKSLPWRE